MMRLLAGDDDVGGGLDQQIADSVLIQERDPFTDLRRLLQSSDLTLTGMLSDLD